MTRNAVDLISFQCPDQNNQDGLRNATAGVLLHRRTGRGASVDNQGKRVLQRYHLISTCIKGLTLVELFLSSCTKRYTANANYKKLTCMQIHTHKTCGIVKTSTSIHSEYSPIQSADTCRTFDLFLGDFTDFTWGNSMRCFFPLEYCGIGYYVN